MNADEYRQQLLALLPRGDAWPKDPDSQQSKVMGALAHEFARVDGRAADLRLEFNPATATEMLDEWEASHGLPDYCATVPTTPEDRRTALMARRLEGHPYHPDDYATALTALGADPFFIEEHAAYPWLCDIGACGDALWSDEWMHVWSIALSGPRDDAIVCAIERNVQAQTLLLWRWAQLRWSDAELSSPDNALQAIAFGGTTGIVVGTGGVVARSTVAGTWVVDDLSDASPGDVNWRSIAADGAGKWIAVGQRVGSTDAMQAVSTDDGATWTVGPIEVSSVNIGNGTNGVAFGNSKWMVCKGSGNIYVSADDGGTWTLHATGGSQVDILRYDATAARWFACGPKIHVSDNDGTSWTETLAVSGCIGTAVARIGASVVAVAVTGTLGAIVNTIHESADDGDTWTAGDAILNGRIVADLAYGGSAPLGAIVTTFRATDAVPAPAARMSDTVSAWEDQPVVLWRAAFGRGRVYAIGGDVNGLGLSGFGITDLGLAASRIYVGEVIT